MDNEYRRFEGPKRSDKHKKHKAFENKKRRLPCRLKIFLITIGIILILGLTGYGTILVGGEWIVDEEDLVLDATTVIETTDGEVISKLYDENRTPVSLEKIPEHVQHAFTSIEDRRFYDHGGIDFRSVFRAVFQNILAMNKVEGASTITQQVAKNLFLTNDKTWARKTKEVMAALNLERKYSKDQILELYLNDMYFGEGIYGVETASNYFFSKPVDDLSVAEGALLAGLAKAPNGYSPINHAEKALDRRNVVLNAMEETGAISTDKRVQEQEKPLDLDVEERESNPWVDSYVDLAMKEAADKHELSVNELKRGGYRVIVNMDEGAQQTAYEQFQNEDYFPGNTEGTQGAFVMMEQETGKIISAIGGRDYQIGDLNRTTVTRQPGSTMKPIAVYGPAMTQEYTPFTLIPDRQMDYDDYTVTNVDDQYEDMVTMYDALRTSKNTSAVWLLDQIGVDYSKEYLAQLGINLEDDGLSIALGGLSEGLTPIELMESYGMFARHGSMIESSTIDRIYDRDDEMIVESSPSSHEVFSPQVAWNMTEMLLDTVESGTAKHGDYNKALAGKTGSTQHAFVEGETNDAWFVGYTPEYTTALWMGYDEASEDQYLTGGSEYPTRLTKAILREMDNQEALTESFAKPDDVDALPEPIELPQITNVNADYSFGNGSPGSSLLQGKLTWEGSTDDRVVYRVYRKQEGIDKRVGEVEGQTEFEIDTFELFGSNTYYVVPYDPLTKLEGERSSTVSLP
ncbi:PBP1A family penicillin-binding protein [Virgibacillus sp. NKC19-3]|uniref:transglycosylase domain-containing protein n=1 Tax=Virgibacillus saliphilus TaxID=2831674 RepID=UPI001C9BB3D7|nr:PBP1A family penicillin-binding protein [Virgibacillus sp. NKC19-3]MBY7143054.1 PBP1A family penicillin-binding protein [Virgibacillus sp. NKC19-3]